MRTRFTGFTIAEEERKFGAVKTVIDVEAVVVSSPSVTNLSPSIRMVFEPGLQSLQQNRAPRRSLSLR